MLSTRTWLSLLSLTLTCSATFAADWPQFLGPDRNGISAETGLIAAWPAGGIREVWRVPGGVGMSAVSVASGNAYTMVQDSANQYLVVLSATTGKEIRRTRVAPAYKNQQGDGPRATPTIDKGIAYVFTGEGVLAAVSLEKGEVLWSINTPRELRGKAAEYGMSSSPLVVGDVIVVHPGTRDGAVAAFSKKDGKLQWKAGSGAAGYSSPTLLKFGGASQVVSFTGAAAFGIQPRSGKLLWTYPYVTDFNCNTATPIIVSDKLFLSAGENHGSVMLASAAKSVKEVWKSQGNRSSMRNEWQTSIHLDGFLYGFDNVGSAGPVTHLNCVNAKTGEEQWQKTRFGKGNLIAADGKLFIVTVKGELVVVTVDSKKYEELGRQVVCDFTRQAPSLVNGLLYLRDDKDIICLDVRAK